MDVSAVEAAGDRPPRTPVGAPLRWPLVVEAIEQLAAAPTLDQVVAILRNTARRIAGADGIAVVLREGVSCHYVAEDASSPLWMGQRFPMSVCVSGWSMSKGVTAVIPDVFADARVPHEAYRQTFVRSMAMVPIGRPEATAALGAYWAELHMPSDDELAMLEALARSASTALENIRLADELRASEARARLVASELDHRTKNVVAVVRSLVQQGLRDSRVPGDVRETLDGRLDAFAAAHGLVGRFNAKPADLTAIASAVLAPYLGAEGRVRVRGGSVELPARAAIPMTLALHELATNAAKYGALSNHEGTVDLSWRIGDDGTLFVEWLERGGPPVAPPARRGFGTRMIERSLASQLGGRVDIRFEPEGLVAHIEAALAATAAT